MNEWEEHLNRAQPSKNRNLRIRRRKIAPKYNLGKYDWRLTSKDFEKGEKILEGELLINLVPELNRENTFDALVFCQLAQRQRYDLQVELYRNMKLAGLLAPEKIMAEEDQLLKLFRRDASLYRQKYINVRSSAEFWLNTDYPEKLVEDATSEHDNGEDLR
ncbi:MAG: hypothetical protein KKI14_03820, partial [Nanoarchaeota archaeon]|nr:hypothetical protein [Nanoarchaeota archaeon]